MESTEDSGIMQNAIDGNIQSSNDFANDLYGKLESDISFEDALKNNNSNADQDMPYIEVSAENFGLNNLNGSTTYQNNESVRENEKMDVEQCTEPSSLNEASGETAGSVSNLMETGNAGLVDDILGEANQSLNEVDGAETGERLLANAAEVPLGLNEGEQQQNPELSSEIQDAISRPTEEIDVSAKAEEVDGELAQSEENNPTDAMEEVEYVVEEPGNNLNTSAAFDKQNTKQSIEIYETESITIEEISTDGSVTSNSNPPTIVAPDDQEKVRRNIEIEESIELLESAVVEDDKIEEMKEETLKHESIVIVSGEDSGNSLIATEVEFESSTNADTSDLNHDAELAKQIEEAPIIIDEGIIETEQQLEEVVLEHESVEENEIVIEDTEIINYHEDEGNATNQMSQSEREKDNTEKQKAPVALEKIKIPHHVLGTNIEKPVRDLCSNGRVPPKPRLGVKIPYRNLTSQIVSKQEIEKVILDRARAKQQQPPAGGDLFFTKKLTQRLARKIIPEERKKAAELEEQKRKELEEEKKQRKHTELKSEQDNADLLAILEGDADDITDVAGSSNKCKEDIAEIKQWEKEVALKQLQEMPQRRRGRSAGLEHPVVKKTGNSTIKKITSDTSKPAKATESKPSAIPVFQKTSSEENSKENADSVADDDIQPRFSTTAVKTYTRKRKPTDTISTIAKTVDVDTSPKKPLKIGSEQKVSIDLPPNTYVTKSSRVIKRKVIWDPDEAASPIRSYKASKSDVSPKQEPAVVSPKPVEKKPPAKLPQKAVEEKVKSPQKIAEEKPKVPIEKSPQKKSPALKKPKRLTEVDKLLMDEGAVNMIYDVKTTEDQNQIKQKKKNLSTISLDKAQRELLNKTNEIKNDLQISSTRASSKSLRKKDGTSSTPPQSTKKEVVQPGQISRKKSKDSNRSSVHSPPASPAYVFPQHADASRIIRRHSSSSFSSGDEGIQKESSDKEELNPAKVVKKKTSTDQKPVKKLKVEKESLNSADKKQINDEMTKSFNELIDKKEKYGEFKTLSVKTDNKMIHITMNVGKKDALMNVQMLNELFVVLNQIKNDESCNAVLLTSSHKSFCQGLDYKYLVADTNEQRKKKATTLANAVKELLQSLATFPKFIAAAVQGNTVGLGVTMLPLFDMVLSSDKASYSMPYCRLGCVAEGGCLLNLPHVAGCGLASELLYPSQKIAAGDAAKRGLVTRIVWAEKFEEDVLNTVLAISNQSQQALQGVKKQLRQSWIDGITSSLETEVEILVQQWMSAECQKNFGKYKLDKE